MGNTYADGAIPWDSFLAPFSTGAPIFIFENFNPTEPSSFDVSNDQTMVPRGGRDTVGVITASATAQFPAGATVTDCPKRFDTFTHPSYRGATKLFLLTEIGLPQTAGKEIKVSIKCREVINPPGGGGPVV